jgi:hypothetical protein
MAKRQSSVEGAKRAPRTGRAADFTRQAMGATRARRLSTSQVATATLLGQFVEAAYAMFQANPGDPTPPPSPNFPTGYKLIAGIEMRDFIIGSTEHLFYGFIAQSTTAANQFVAAFRGTVGGVEWWDDFNSIVLTPFRVPGCGSVGAGFARIYNTIALVAYASAAAPKTPLVERSLSSPARCRSRWRPSFPARPDGARRKSRRAARGHFRYWPQSRLGIGLPLRSRKRQDEQVADPDCLHLRLAPGWRQGLCHGLQRTRPDLIALRHRPGSGPTTPPGILWFPARQYTSISKRNREGAAKLLVLARADELSEPRQPEPAAGSGMRDRDRCRCKTAGVAWRHAGLVAEYGTGLKTTPRPMRAGW